MYVYDEANNLAKAIQESKEYEEYKKAKEDIASNQELKAKIDDFEKIRYDLQAMAFQGKDDPEKMKKLPVQMLCLILLQKKIQKSKDQDHLKLSFDLLC